MAVKVDVRLGLLAVQKFHLEIVDEVEEEPLGLQHGEFLAGAQRAEGDEGVLQLLAILEELGVNKPVVLVHLKNTKAKNGKLNAILEQQVNMRKIALVQNKIYFDNDCGSRKVTKNV